MSVHHNFETRLLEKDSLVLGTPGRYRSGLVRDREDGPSSIASLVGAINPYFDIFVSLSFSTTMGDDESIFRSSR